MEPQLVLIPDDEWLTRIAALTWMEREKFPYSDINQMTDYTWIVEGDEIPTHFKREQKADGTKSNDRTNSEV